MVDRNGMKPIEKITYIYVSYVKFNKFMSAILKSDIKLTNQNKQY